MMCLDVLAYLVVCEIRPAALVFDVLQRRIEAKKEPDKNTRN